MWSLTVNSNRLRVKYNWRICSPLQYFFVFGFGYKGNAVSDLSNYPQSDHTSTANLAEFVGFVLNKGIRPGRTIT